MPWSLWFFITPWHVNGLTLSGVGDQHPCAVLHSYFEMDWVTKTGKLMTSWFYVFSTSKVLLTDQNCFLFKKIISNFLVSIFYWYFKHFSWIPDLGVSIADFGFRGPGFKSQSSLVFFKGKMLVLCQNNNESTMLKRALVKTLFRFWMFAMQCMFHQICNHCWLLIRQVHKSAVLEVLPVLCNKNLSLKSVVDWQ